MQIITLEQLESFINGNDILSYVTKMPTTWDPEFQMRVMESTQHYNGTPQMYKEVKSTEDMPKFFLESNQTKYLLPRSICGSEKLRVIIDWYTFIIISEEVENEGIRKNITEKWHDYSIHWQRYLLGIYKDDYKEILIKNEQNALTTKREAYYFAQQQIKDEIETLQNKGMQLANQLVADCALIRQYYTELFNHFSIDSFEPKTHEKRRKELK